jgi:hypothetical protein
LVRTTQVEKGSVFSRASLHQFNRKVFTIRLGKSAQNCEQLPFD